MRKRLSVFACLCVLTAIGSGPAAAQDEAPPEVRYVTVTTFDVPFGDRADFMSFLEEYFLPGTQLHPKVLNSRVLTHSWGSTGDQIVLVAEYATWDDIEADCGAPCETYFDQHEAPEEGESGYEEYQAKQALFNKYYSGHQDEIYVTQVRRAVIEGEMQGVVGPQPEAEDEDE